MLHAATGFGSVHDMVHGILGSTTSRVIVLWDIDDTMLTNDRKEWCCPDEVAQFRACVNFDHQRCHHLLLSAGTTSDAFAGHDTLLGPYKWCFGVPVSVGDTLCVIPATQHHHAPPCVMTLRGIKGISTNRMNHIGYLPDPEHMHVRCTKLEVVMALASSIPDCVVVFVDNSLHELGLAPKKGRLFHQFRSWLQQHNCDHNVHLLHFRPHDDHPVRICRYQLSGMPQKAYERLMQQVLTTQQPPCAPRWGPLHANVRASLIASAVQSNHHSLIALLQQAACFSTILTFMQNDWSLVDHSMRCQLLFRVMFGGLRSLPQMVDHRAQSLLVREQGRLQHSSPRFDKCPPPESTEILYGMDPL